MAKLTRCDAGYATGSLGSQVRYHMGSEHSQLPSASAVGEASGRPGRASAVVAAAAVTILSRARIYKREVTSSVFRKTSGARGRAREQGRVWGRGLE